LVERTERERVPSLDPPDIVIAAPIAIVFGLAPAS
jgi:hypothetical protein